MLTVSHTHVPVYRVVRASWRDPLDTSHARATGGRWNAPGSRDALYTACSEPVARAITLDIFRLAAITFEDLTPQAGPALVEIDWSGDVVDVASPEGIAGAGFRPSYPTGYSHARTQRAAHQWFDGGAEGVLCRSASIDRLGPGDWSGPHERWSELAIFPQNAANPPRLIRKRRGHAWLK